MTDVVGALRRYLDLIEGTAKNLAPSMATAKTRDGVTAISIAADKARAALAALAEIKKGGDKVGLLLDATKVARDVARSERDKARREVSRLHGRIEGLESALSEADATTNRLESERAELAREVERLREEAESHLKECGRLSERRHRDNAALRAILRCGECGALKEYCSECGAHIDIDAALGAGKETQP